RIMRPGCKVDHMIVLEGPQGIKKSQAIEKICGTEWYMDSTEPVHSKDFLQALPGRWIVEIGDLSSFARADKNKIKQVVSCQVDVYRESYGRRAIPHERQCIFVGTTNESVWLDDPTGGRRFLPVCCEAIDLD